MSKYIDTKKKPLFFKITRFIVRIFYRKREFKGVENIPSEPSLIIGNHAQAHGPLSCELFFPTKKYIWCIGEMMNVKEVPSYAYKDFWSHKPKWIRWLFKIISYIIAPLVYFLKKADTIAVYKDARIVQTFKETVDKLAEGANVVIFPECPTEFNNIVNEFQDKFVDVARLYYKKYNKEISFVPMYNSPQLKTIVFGKPIKFDASKEIEEQRKVICDYLKEEITRMAKELPAHTVVPYLNIKKKDYPISKGNKKVINKTKKLAVCGVFGALATILYVVPFFKFPLPFLFPSFLEFNFSDIPTLIAGFTYGPGAAFFVHLVKILIKLPMTSTAFVGELADFIIGLLFVLPAIIYYRKHKTKKGAFIGLTLSLLIATSMACLVNRYITIPFYTGAFGLEAVLGMAQSANSSISDVKWSLVLWGVLPFNFIKNIVVCVLSFFLYKKISNVIKKYGAK